LFFYPVTLTKAMIIPLRPRSLEALSDLTRRLGRAALKRPPIWSCSWWGLPCLHCHQWSGELLPHRFTLTTGRCFASSPV